MPYDEAQIKVFPLKELKELASNMSVNKYGSRPDLVMRLEKSHAPMLKMLFDKCKKEKEEKKKEKKEEKEKPKIITAQGEKFSEKFVRDYNLKYVKSVTDADGNVNHHYVFKKKAVASAGKTDPKTDDPKTTASTASTAAASTTIASPKTKTASKSKTKTSPAPEKKKRKREEEEEEEVVSEDDPDPHYSKGIFKARMRMCLGGDRAFLNSLIKKYDNVSIKLIQKLTDEEAIDHCVEHMTGEEIDSDDEDEGEDDEDEDEGEGEGDDEGDDE